MLWTVLPQSLSNYRSLGRCKTSRKTRGVLPQGLWLILMFSSSRPGFLFFFCWHLVCTTSLDKQYYSTIVQRRASPADCFLSARISHSTKCYEVDIQTVYEFEKKRSSSEGFRDDCHYLAGEGGQRKEVVGLAELGADSYGKLWIEVDKDISVVGNVVTEAGWETGAFCDSKYSEEGQKQAAGQHETNVSQSEMEKNLAMDAVCFFGRVTSCHSVVVQRSALGCAYDVKPLKGAAEDCSYFSALQQNCTTRDYRRPKCDGVLTSRPATATLFST